MEVRLQCAENDMKFDAKLQFEAVDSETSKGRRYLLQLLAITP